MAEEKRVTTDIFARKKNSGEKIAMVTAYDHPGARLADAAGVDAILVGDSLGMVVLGYDSTIPVTLADILHHTKAVVRGTTRAMVVADMPFLSYQVNEDEAVRNAGRLLQEGGAGAIKLEGGRRVAPLVSRLTAAGIPVMGHLGLTPQSVYQFGGYKLQAGSAKAALQLLNEAALLAQAGVFAIVLEKVPREVAAVVTARIAVPTIGIASGPDCDGQVLVFHDLLGLNEFKARHVKHYAQIGAAIQTALAAYVSEVADGSFPGPEHAWPMESGELHVFQEEIARMGVDGP